MKILFVIPSLDYGGAARQLTLIASGLPRDRFRPRVCVLGRTSPWAEELRAAGIDVDILGWKRPFEPAPFVALRRLLAEARPNVVHFWGRTGLRAAAALAGGRRTARLFVSAALPIGRRTAWLDRWLLRRADVVVAFGESEADRCRDLGVHSERIAVVAPGVRMASSAPPPADLPQGRLLFGAGPIEAHKGFRDAVWALDILHYLYEDLRLILAGDGPDRARLEAFAAAIGVTDRVAFLGRRPDLGPWLHAAELAWVPSRAGGGVNAALEAMAAGKPVIAARLPALAEIVIDGEVGCLTPPGDKTELARQTRFLLNDADRRRACGEAGRRRAAEHFSVEKLVQRCAELYEEGERGASAP
ncbi:MAG TPA: glycosyltransferase [Gemmataceae bacterium]|nr:glycosyltransferase [Gemmataceae bacterium]